jgi:molybdate transport system substrate-binding protein
MRSMPSTPLAGTLAIAVLALAACSAGAASTASGSPPSGQASPAPPAASANTPAPATPEGRVELTIYGAASLKGALEEARTAYEAANPGVTLAISTDASSALATKIEQGAPADVFLSADTTNPERLSAADLTKGRAVVFAGNRLAVVVPTGNPAGITTPADLARPGVKVIAAGAAVPITQYADQVVANLAQEPGYPADFAASYQANVVSREDNARAVVAKLELGEGDAGIVYASDAGASAKVQTVALPDSANVLATYAGVVIGTTRHAAAAGAFLAWLAGPEGQAILGSFGFLPPP